jgi:hypothetical protein
MGIDPHNLRFLLWCRQRGVSLAQTVTLGRQQLALTDPQLQSLARTYGVSLPRLASGPGPAYAEALLQALGAEQVDSIDASDYEGATRIADLNEPLAGDRQYSCVVDAGTLEHVYNLAGAFANCLRLLRPGGHILHMVPCNNYFGHGFHQFGPEVFYRTYAEENGCRVVAMVLVELDRGGRWFKVPDPKLCRRRITFANAFPSQLMVLAEKLTDTACLPHWPQQSDYDQLVWRGDAPLAPPTRGALFRVLTRSLASACPTPVYRHLRAVWAATRSQPDLEPFPMP